MKFKVATPKSGCEPQESQDSPLPGLPLKGLFDLFCGIGIAMLVNILTHFGGPVVPNPSYWGQVLGGISGSIQKPELDPSKVQMIRIQELRVWVRCRIWYLRT